MSFFIFSHYCTYKAISVSFVLVKSDFIRSWPILFKKRQGTTQTLLWWTWKGLKWWCLPHWFGSKFLKQHFKSFLCADYIKTILATLQDFTVSYIANRKNCQWCFVIIKIKARLYSIKPMQSILSSNIHMIDWLKHNSTFKF